MKIRPLLTSPVTSLFILLFVVLFVLPAPTHAERFTLDPVTAVATRHERPLATTPASVTVLTSEDLVPYAAQPLEDILAKRAGVTVARSGGPGQQTSIFLRGTDSDSMLVLVDGMKLNGETFGGANLQNLRGADIERIEVIRGPRSTLYGSEAIGGVISITTRRAADAETLTVQAGGGSDETGHLRVAVSQGGEDRHISAAISHFRTDGDPITELTNITGKHENTSGTLHAQMRLGDTQIGTDVWAARGETRYLDTFALTALHQEFDNVAASVWGETALGTQTADSNATLRLRLGHAADEIDQVESADFAQTRRLVGEANIILRNTFGDSLHKSSNTLVAGMDAEREDVNALVYGSAIVADNDIQALFFRDDLTLGAHHMALGIRIIDHDAFDIHRTGEASYGFQFTNDLFGWIAGGSGFRAPTATERFGYGGNPLLKPETTRSSEVGLRRRLGIHEFTLTGFRQTIDDLIDYPAPAYNAVNIARAIITGTELGWSLNADNLHLDIFATVQDPIDDTTGEQLSRRPEQQLSITARHRTGAIEWRTSMLAMDKRDNSAFDTVILPGFAVFDAGVVWTIRPKLVLDARVENIGDIRYAMASGSAGDYRMPDRAFFLGIDWRH